MTSASVVIPAYNAAATIGDTLHALRSQSNSPTELEIIVVDNGSTDATREVAASFSGVHVVDETKRGPSAARNCGLRHAANQIIVHLDADTLPTRKWLASMLAPFSDPSVMLAAGRTLIFHPETPVERYIAAAGLYETDRAISREPFPFVPSLNMAVRKSAALAIGGWAEELMTAEDVDFSHRLLKRFPTEIAYCPEAVLFHRVRSTPQELSKLAWTYGQGVARMYIRYRDEVRWTALTTARISARLVLRALTPKLLSVLRQVGLASPEQVDFSRCHYLWSSSFCRGFFNIYYGPEGAQAARVA